MSSELEIRERQKVYLKYLLNIKKANREANIPIVHLDEVINIVLSGMNQEDIAWVEKLSDIKAID